MLGIVLGQCTVSRDALGRGTFPRHVTALGQGTVSRQGQGRVTVSRHALSRGTLPRHLMALDRGTVSRHALGEKPCLHMQYAEAPFLGLSWH